MTIVSKEHGFLISVSFGMTKGSDATSTITRGAALTHPAEDLQSASEKPL